MLLGHLLTYHVVKKLVTIYFFIINLKFFFSKSISLKYSLTFSFYNFSQTYSYELDWLLVFLFINWFIFYFWEELTSVFWYFAAPKMKCSMHNTINSLGTYKRDTKRWVGWKLKGIILRIKIKGLQLREQNLTW